MDEELKFRDNVEVIGGFYEGTRGIVTDELSDQTEYYVEGHKGVGGYSAYIEKKYLRKVTE